MRVDHEKDGWGEKSPWGDGVRVHHEKKSDGVRVHHKKERSGES